MGVYIFILCFLISFSVIDYYVKIPDRYRNVLFLFSFLILVFHDGLRWETGTDWNMYVSIYEDYTRHLSSQQEIVFLSVNNWFSQSGFPYTVFLVFLAVIYWALYCKSIKDYAVFPFITLLIFYCSSIGYLGMSRQHLALAICLFSLRFVINKKPIPFILSIIIACLFHRTAIVFCIVYFFNRHIKNKFIYIALFIAVLINTFDIPFYFLKFISSFGIFPSAIQFRLTYYLSIIDETFGHNLVGSFLGIIRRFFIFVPAILFKEKLEKEYSNFNLFLNIYIFSLLIFFSFNNSFQLFVGRLNVYFDLLSVPFILSAFLLLFKKLSFKNISILGIIILYSLVIFIKQISVRKDLFVPYKGIFINKSYEREMY